jgi:hypothetical protein
MGIFRNSSNQRLLLREKLARERAHREDKENGNSRARPAQVEKPADWRKLSPHGLVHNREKIKGVRASDALSGNNAKRALRAPLWKEELNGTSQRCNLRAETSSAG